MTLSPEGEEFIKSFEGFSLTVYKDIVGLLTVGWGCRTNMPEGTVITQDEAESMFQKRVSPLISFIESVVAVSINAQRSPEKMTQGNFDALVSFAYNVGIHALQTSTLLEKFLDGDITGAADQFLAWDHAGGKIVPGLLRRREAERELFLSNKS